MAQDDYYYEIQLTNKQLVFYFMAGATGLILSFLAGVMVGRGVDAGAEAQAPRPVQEERVVAEESPRPEAARPVESLDYARRLEGPRTDEGRERKVADGGAAPRAGAPLDLPQAAPAAGPASAAAGPVATPAASKPSPGARVPAPERSQRPSPAPAQPERARPGAAAAAKPPAAASAKPADVPATPGTFTVQVGAFRERKVADSVAARLKSKGFPAYVISPEGAAGVLFNVRVGAYPARPDAERAQERLRDQEKFKPFIVKN